MCIRDMPLARFEELDFIGAQVGRACVQGIQEGVWYESVENRGGAPPTSCCSDLLPPLDPAPSASQGHDAPRSEAHQVAVVVLCLCRGF